MATERMPWSFTLSTDSRTDYEALVVCCFSLPQLGIERLVDEVREFYGDDESRRWYRARAEEFARCLLNSLRMHLPSAELIVHVEEGDDSERVRVVVPGGGDEGSSREAELSDRVGAIRQRTWTSWLESLQVTMTSLRRLHDYADVTPPPTPADRAA